MSKPSAEVKLNIQRQLRPIRLAFLVLPDDSKTLRLIFETNTCLWGGIQNPIIPVHRRKPAHWGARFKWPGGVEYAQGMLGAFEPDFVVETKQGLGKRLEVPGRRLLTLADIVNPDRDPRIGYGVSAVDVLHHAYDEDLKFVRRQKLKAVWAGSEQTRPTLFEAAVLGAYPDLQGLSYLRTAYLDAFEPESVSGNHVSLFEAIFSGAVTPLRAHQYGLEDRRGLGWRSHNPILFLLDPKNTSDLVEYWNLRAWGAWCFPFPIDAIKELSTNAIELIKRTNVRLLGNPDPNMKHQTTLLKARSISAQTHSDAADSLQPRPPDSLVLQDWIPRYWDATTRSYDISERSDLVGAHDDMDIVVDEDKRIRFDLLEPEFDTYIGWAALPRWANTILLRDFTSTQTGLVYPQDGQELAHLLLAFEDGGFRATRNGIAVVSSGVHSIQHWEVPDGQAVIRDWFSTQKLPFVPSAAGKTAAEVARALGGLNGLRILESIDTLKMLNGAAEGGAIHHHELLGLLKRVEKHPEAPDNLLRSLVERSILRIGLLLTCPACETEGWFPLENLADGLRCSRCLRVFGFPGHRPPNSKKWAYRTQGPFALSGYAKGAYATLFALRFLGPTHDGEMTWFPGCEVGSEGSKYELDFVAFWRKRWARTGPARILIGECKTFDKFTPKEVGRFREVGKQFPEAIRVFATLRSQLDEGERIAISALAREGRRTRGSRSPVLVLTATELLSTSRPPYCYKDAGAQFEKFKNFNLAPMTDDNGLPGLCDLTQQLHLGMEPTWTTVHKEIEKRRARAQKQQVNQTEESTILVQAPSRQIPPGRAD